MSLSYPHHTPDILLSEYGMGSSYISRSKDHGSLARRRFIWPQLSDSSTHSWAIDHSIVNNSSPAALRCRSLNRESGEESGGGRSLCISRRYIGHMTDLRRNRRGAYVSSIGRLLKWSNGSAP